MSSLYYVGDPMCSWCWGFAPVLEDAVRILPKEVEVRYIMGGLARDSDESMPEEVRNYIQDNWRAVAATTGAQFNWEFWEKCDPRRSTYPSCRATIAAGLQRALPQMFSALQRAFYLEARNPSDSETQIELAEKLGLEVNRFADDLVSSQVEEMLQADFVQRRLMEVREFPSMLLETEKGYANVLRGWASLDTVLDRLRSLLKIP